MPLRADPAEPAGPIDATILTEDGGAIAFRAEPGEAGRIALADGRTILERLIALPDLPIGRHRLIVDGVECALVVAPPEAHLAKAALRRRFGVSAQLYALKRDGDQGIGDFTTLGRAGALAGEAGAAFFGVSPLHHLFPRRPRAREPLPSVGPALPRPDPHRRARPLRPAATTTSAPPPLAALGGRSKPPLPRRASNIRRPGRSSARRSRRATPPSRARAPPGPTIPIFADYDRFVAAGGEALRRFAIFEAIAARRGGEDWRRWPAPLRDGERDALAARGGRGIRGGRLRPVQPVARRPPARRRGRAGESRRARDRLLSRSRGRRGARRRRELGASRRVGAQRHRRRAARPVLDPGPDLEPAAARPARLGARRLARLLAR